jgi:competence protein ComEC
VDRVVVRAELVAAEVGGQRVTESASVLLLAPAAGWLTLLPGQQVSAQGALASTRSSDLGVAVLRVRGPPTEATPAPPWQRVAESLRAGLRHASGVLDEESEGLLPGLVEGDTSALSSRVVDEFRIAGLTHLTAVSGANLAIVCGAVLLLLRLFRCGPRTCGVGAMLALVGFVVLAGPQASVLRAAVMGGVALLALVLGRERSAVPALAAAVIVLVLLDPGLGLDAGFALSVLATGSLVLLAPRWAERLRARGVPEALAEALAAPVAAGIATAPVVAGLSGHVSLVEVVANLVADPVVAPATVFGVLAAVSAPVHPGTAEFFVHLAGPEVDWLIQVARRAAAVPGALVSWPTGWLGGVLLSAVIGVGWLLLRLRRVRVLLAAVAVGALVVALPTQVVDSGWPAAGWSVVSCDVGQGDAEVLATAEPDRAVLVDTGPEPGPVSDCLRRLGVRRIPLVVLSHLHADHVGGLASVLAEHTVGAVAVGPLREPDWAWQEVRRLTSAAGVPLVDLAAGQHLEWPGLAVDVLGPRRVLDLVAAGGAGSLVNDASLVLRATTPAGRVLLTGDVELAGQNELLAHGEDVTADVLKVPHHGSRFSLPEFLNRVHPRVALVSVGAGNRYGHPSPETLHQLGSTAALVLRTDQSGDTAVLPGPTGPRVVRRGSPRAPPHH